MVHMANQIALNFAAYSGEEAVAGIAEHLRMFWGPRKRAQLMKYVAEGGAGLHDLALAAVRRLDPVDPPARPA